ncbi:lariat debranching enzyme [Rhodosporidiobolus nylandii]
MSPLPPPRSLKLAIIGCSHGTLDEIYASVERADEELRKKGEREADVVAMRNTSDLETMACPPKYRSLGHFYQYYAGEKQAKKLTIVIGGNHESSGFLWELYHGGWLAPNIYFLGFAGSVLIDGWLRLSGASGIWKGGDFRKGHFETVPYDNSTIRSVYHIREYDVARLLQLKNRPSAPIDVFLSHDWPLGIEQHGDTQALVREKPFFRDEIERNALGSPPLHALLTALKPRYWFSAHLHVKFAALFKHDGAATTVKGAPPRAPAQGQGAAGQPLIRFVGGPVPLEQPQQPAGGVGAKENPDEIMLDDDDDEEEGPKSEEKGCDHSSGGCVPSAHEAVNPDEVVLGDEEDEEQNEEEEEDTQKEAEEVERMLLDPAGRGAGPPPAAAEEGMEVEPEQEKKAVREEKHGEVTRFLALSKPGRGRDFLQVVDIPPIPSSSAPSNPAVPAPSADSPPPPPQLYYDPHWLAILRSTAPYLSLSHQQTPFPPLAELEKQIERDYEWVLEHVGEGGDGMKRVEEVQHFVGTAPTQSEWEGMGRPRMPSWYTNPQTLSLTALLQIENKINPIPEGYLEALAAQKAEEEKAKKEALEEAKRAALADLDLGGAVDEEPKGEHPAQTRRKEELAAHAQAEAQQKGNADEIQIEDEDDE